MQTYTPRPYQLQAIADLRASVAAGHRAPVLVMGTGCHAAGTEILMFDGSLRPVESIRVGDLVMGPDSQPRRVLALHRGEDEMFRVTPVKGDPFVVNGDHVLSLKTLNDGSKWAGMVRNVTVREWLSASKTFRHVNKLYRVAVEFQSGDTLRVHPYLLGALIGDGCLGYGAALIANPDAEIKAELTAIAAGCGLTISDHKDDGRCPQYALVTPRGKPNPLRQAILDLGLRCRSSHKFIPAEYKVASRHDRLELLAGLLDTDGHLSGNCYDFVSASEALARDTAFVARSVGLAAYVKPCRKAWQNGVGDYWRVSISGDTDMIPCRVVRKQAPKRKQIKSVLVTGFKVDPIGAGEYFGFECDGDNLYLMGDFTVTHNSGKTICAAHLILGAVNKGRKVLFLSPRRELVYQTSEKLAALDVPHGIIMAGERPSMMPDVQVVSVPTLFARYFRDHDDGAFARELPPADLIVIDEIHASMSTMTMRILAAYPKAVRIGLTATPARSDGRGLGEICDDMVFGPSVAELTEMGMLVPLRYFGAEQADLSKVRMQAGDYHQADLGELMSQPKLVGDVVQNWLRLCPDRLTVVFAVNRAHAMALQQEFQHAGVSAGYIDGETPNDERHEIFAEMERGDTRVLCSVDVVSMGWDCLDEHTEILTAGGWRGIDDIEGESHVWAFNTDSGAAELVEIQQMGSRLVREGELMLAIESQYMNVRTTEGHRFYVKKKYGRQHKPEAEFRVKTGRELHDEDLAYYLPLSAKAEFPGVGLSDDELRLVAWILTDGYLAPDGHAEIYQSKTDNIPRIRAMLDRVGVLYSERRRTTTGYSLGIKETEMTVFRTRSIRKGGLAPHVLLALVGADGRKELRHTMEQMTEAQFDVFWWEMLLGDGEQLRPENLGGYLWTAIKSVADRLSAMGALRGYHTVVREKKLKSGTVMYVVGARKRSFMQVGNPQSGENRNYQTRKSLTAPSPGERVWCVTNRLGTLITRRNGKVSILGNCPQVSCGIIARPTKSIARYLQMVGRIMRIHPLKSDAYVIDHAGAVDELGFADDPQPWSLDGKSKIQERKAAEKKEPQPIECSQCHQVFRPAKICPGCGHDMGGRAAKAIEAHEAELHEIDRKTRAAKPKAFTMADKQDWWSGFLHMARDRGKSHKWVLAQYKTKFGVWPRGLVDTPLPPAPEMVSWEQSQRIRYAKGPRR